MDSKMLNHGHASCTNFSAAAVPAALDALERIGKSDMNDEKKQTKDDINFERREPTRVVDVMGRSEGCALADDSSVAQTRKTLREFGACAPQRPVAEIEIDMPNSEIFTQEAIARRIVELFASDPMILAQGRAFGLSVSAIEPLRKAIAACGHPDAEMVSANIRPLNK